jgi:hypothetical protein
VGKNLLLTWLEVQCPVVKAQGGRQCVLAMPTLHSEYAIYPRLIMIELCFKERVVHLLVNFNAITHLHRWSWLCTKNLDLDADFMSLFYRLAGSMLLESGKKSLLAT